MSNDDTVRIVIDTFDMAFRDFELPACIGIVDSDGLVLHTTGQCPDLELFEGILGTLIMGFGELRRQMNMSFGQVADAITVEFGDEAYYINDIDNTELYLVARTQKDLFWRARPFLNGIVSKIQEMANIPDDE